MKRVLGIALALVSMGFVVPAEAKSSDVSNQNTVATSSATPQLGYDRYGRRDRRYDRRYDRLYDRRYRSRSVTRSRYVRYGHRLYRETYLVTYWSNGRTNTRLISRQRVG